MFQRVFFHGLLITVYVFGCVVAAPSAKKPSSSTSRNVPELAPGIIPVFIRPGDTPLDQIDPRLAEAFKFNAIKYGRYIHRYRIKGDGIARAKIPVDFEDLNEVTTLEEKTKKSEKLIATTARPNKRPDFYFSILQYPFLE